MSMTSFITQTLQDIISRGTPISEYTFILPNKRAGAFLMKELAELNNTTAFAPEVLSIEVFAQQVAQLKSIDNLSALFEFYNVYRENTPVEETEDWETFASWGQTLLQDFNEIDHYLVDYKSVFGSLSDIQEMNQHWSIDGEQTTLVENYLKFWKKLPLYYEKLTEKLESKMQAYQGLIYRKAITQMDAYLKKNPHKHIFMGFNALSTAEQYIIQYMLKKGTAEVFWDIDEVFLSDPHHDASLFLRNYRENWPYYKEHSFNTISSNFKENKNIQTIGIPKNIGQAKQVGEILSKLSVEELKDTAVVLGDEGMLIPIMNALPANIQEVNVTMGYPLQNAPVTFLIEDLLKAHSIKNEAWYYKEVINFLSHSLIQKITNGDSRKIADTIKKENLVYVSLNTLLVESKESLHPLIKIVFGDWKNQPRLAIEKLHELIFYLKDGLDRDKDMLSLEFLYQHKVLLNKLASLLQDYPHLSSIRSLMSVYKELLHKQTVNFRGKPFTGLQVMGLLESRVIDFKNVIVVSVNEGVLPSGKSANSFIPIDLKRMYQLPTYKEKDAVYSYHFHHLLQRSVNIYLLYNTETGGLNAGEKSRFLLQLELETQPGHKTSYSTIAPKVPPIVEVLMKVDKTPQMMERLRNLAARGFSPSALTTYIRNPLDFYKQYILGVREREEMEETVAFNTLGTVVHDTLEKFYKQWEGKELKEDDLKDAIKHTPNEVKRQFEKTYTRDPLVQGKNLLIFEVVKRYVISMLNLDIKDIKEGNQIKIIQVENTLKTPISIDELDFPVYLGGQVDRVDQRNGTVRIIDYKTGKVQQSQVEVVDWEELNTDYDKYSKPFQILAYATMMNAIKPSENPTEAGIVSFKNMDLGFLKFAKKDRKGYGAKKDTLISKDILEAYKKQLAKLIIEICNPEIPFIEKEIPEKSW